MKDILDGLALTGLDLDATFTGRLTKCSDPDSTPGYAPGGEGSCTPPPRLPSPVLFHPFSVEVSHVSRERCSDMQAFDYAMRRIRERYVDALMSPEFKHRKPSFWLSITVDPGG